MISSVNIVWSRHQQYLVPASAGTRHAMLCMHNWAQCVGSHWALACVLDPMCRIPLVTAQGLPPKQAKHSILIYCYLIGDKQPKAAKAGIYAK